jgi:hypothetical protein
MALYLWYQDWSESARTLFDDRRLLIQLGIGKRRKDKAITEPTPPAPATTPVVLETGDEPAPDSRAA